MSTLLYFGERAGIPADEATVRSTITVVQDDAPPAEMDAAPDFNETETDPDTEGGLTTHQLASHVIPSVQYVPHVGNANEDLNAIVDDRISTSGTAAAREMAGEWGHGTLKVVEGIEPAIRDGARFGNEYFAADNRPLAASGDYMTPAQPADAATVARAQATGTDNARDAVSQSQYQAMYVGRMGGLT